jgi:hypothetical protein
MGGRPVSSGRVETAQMQFQNDQQRHDFLVCMDEVKKQTSDGAGELMPSYMLRAG